MMLDRSSLEGEGYSSSPWQSLTAAPVLRVDARPLGWDQGLRVYSRREVWMFVCPGNFGNSGLGGVNTVQ